MELTTAGAMLFAVLQWGRWPPGPVRLPPVDRTSSMPGIEERPRNSYSVCARWAISFNRGPTTTLPMSPTVHIILSSSTTTVESSSVSLRSARPDSDFRQ
ncbi:hypothetical protein [Streptomyces sp. bgisy060]|uniref:hypothetical protein n=1 Tax=Streptomyces sp. bgisy060 TaxID=3413775 RepID=UPI003EBFDDF9